MVELFANSGDPDQTLHSAAPDLVLHCLPVTHIGVSTVFNGLDESELTIFRHLNSFPYLFKNFNKYIVCVEVLRPSQPIWVMSSAVSLPNHTFTGQA